jgi:hypothetical protein
MDNECDPHRVHSGQLRGIFKARLRHPQKPLFARVLIGMLFKTQQSRCLNPTEFDRDSALKGVASRLWCASTWPETCQKAENAGPGQSIKPAYS